MKRFRMIGVALLAVLALGVAIVPRAQAETAPFFTIGGTRLVAGKTHNIDGRAIKPFTLTNALGTIKVTCKAVGTVEAVLLGSNVGLPGKADLIAVFSQCTLEAGNGAPECEIANAAGEPTTVITTEPIKSEQVENVENSKVGKKLYEEFIPANDENGFVTLFFTGKKCTVKETIASGSVVAEVLTDNGGAPKNVELGQTPVEATSWILNFPATPITRVWLISGTGGKIVKTGQTSFGEESVQTGQSLGLLASSKFVPEPGALWSPLP